MYLRDLGDSLDHIILNNLSLLEFSLTVQNGLWSDYQQEHPNDEHGQKFRIRVQRRFP